MHEEKCSYPPPYSKLCCRYLTYWRPVGRHILSLNTLYSFIILKNSEYLI